jgi:hypothetical protein
MFLKGSENVLGSVNTSGTLPTADGVGEPLLEAWLAANKDIPTADATRGLEAFFSAWNQKEPYGQVGDSATIKDEKPAS